MIEELSLGPVPANEECAQLGNENYFRDSRNECKRYLSLLKNTFSLLPGMYFKITRNNHDFGDYFDVVICFNPDDPEQVSLAYYIENNSPTSWEEDVQNETQKI